MRNINLVRKRLYEIFGDNCDKVVTRANFEEANKLRELAEKGVEYATPYAQYIAKELGLNGNAIQIGPQKTLGRIFEKAIGKFDGNLDHIGDVGRLRGLLNGPEDVLELRRMFGVRRGSTFNPMHVDNHVTVGSVQDYFWEPTKTGRIAFHVNLDVTVSGGQSVGIEVQFIDKNMLETERATHINYQKACAIERTACKENREPTKEEKVAMDKYYESNRSVYLADALNYGYYDLRRPDLRLIVPEIPHLKIA